MPKLRVHNLAVSLDGYAAGPNQSVDDPLGVGGTRLHEWALAPAGRISDLPHEPAVPPLAYGDAVRRTGRFQ